MTNLINIENFSNELQSWIAVKSFAVEDAHPDLPIIDANELADFITSLISKYQDEADLTGFISVGQELPLNGEFYEIRYLSDLTKNATVGFEIALCVGSMFMTITPNHLTVLASKTRMIDKFITHFRHIQKHGNLPTHLKMNNAIRNCGNPLCYYPSNIAAIVKEE